jgi:hypothetical protein
MSDRLSFFGYSTRKQSDPISPFTARTFPTAFVDTEEIDQQRSARALAIDKAFNAPLAPDLQTYRENPNRYDVEGVDTIPDEELARRGEAFLQRGAELGLVDEVIRTDPGGDDVIGAFGRTVSNETDEVTKTKITAASDIEEDEFAFYTTGPVLAHEVGHAADFDAGGGKAERGFASDGLFDSKESGDTDANGFDRDQALEEAFKITERMRGTILDYQKSYRESETELVADAIASMALEPRAARREAPELFDLVDEKILKQIGEAEDYILDF